MSDTPPPASAAGPKSPRAKALAGALAQNADPRASEARSRRLVSMLAIGVSCLLLVLLLRMFLLQSGLAPAVSSARLFSLLPQGKPKSFLETLQANTSEQVAEMDDTQTVRRTLASFRGALLDRHGRVLATSQLRHRLCVDPRVIADEIATALEKEWPDRQSMVKKGLAAIPERLQARLTDDLRQALKDRDVEGIHEAFDELIRLESEAPLKAALGALPGRLQELLRLAPDDAAKMAAALHGRENTSYVVLSDLLEPRQAEALKEARAKAEAVAKAEKKPFREPFPGFKGVFLESRSLRNYPQGDTAGQLIGFTGKEEVVNGRRQEKGLDGLEKLWNSRLQSTDGVSECVVDRHRKPVWVTAEGYRLPRDGDNILLSIDCHIQEIAEKQLEITCTKNRVESGILVVMQPYTGEILAIANWPKFDPGGRYSPADRIRLARNRAVADSFEPGSIFKSMVWASLVDDGYMRPEEKVDTTLNGEYRLPSGRLLHDADAARGHGHGLTDWNGVLAMSSNIGMAKGGLKVKDAWLHDTLEKWGFGHATGAGLPGEAPGILRPVKHRNPRLGWDKYTPSSLTMGQSINVTALQIVRAYCAIANGGVLLTPTTEALDGRRDAGQDEKPAGVRVISEDAAAKTRAALRLVMTHEHGTGRQASSKYYDIFGKTGTAQLPNIGGKGYGNFYTSSFVGGAPLDHPRLVVGCFLRKTRKGQHFGGVVAAPYVKNTLEASLIYLGVPTNPGTDPSKMYQDWETEVKKQADLAGVDFD